MSIMRTIYFAVDITDANRTLSEEYKNSQDSSAILCNRALNPHTMLYTPSDDKTRRLPDGFKEKMVADKLGGSRKR